MMRNIYHTTAVCIYLPWGGTVELLQYILCAKMITRIVRLYVTSLNSADSIALPSKGEGTITTSTSRCWPLHGPLYHRLLSSAPNSTHSTHYTVNSLLLLACTLCMSLISISLPAARHRSMGWVAVAPAAGCTSLLAAGHKCNLTPPRLASRRVTFVCVNANAV